MWIPGSPPFYVTSDSDDWAQNAQLLESSDVTLCTQAPRCRKRGACDGIHSFSGDRGSESTVDQPARREIEVEQTAKQGKEEEASKLDTETEGKKRKRKRKMEIERVICYVLALPSPPMTEAK